MNVCRTPVVVFAFNRPRKVERLLEILALVRPSTLLIVADGPRSTHAEDADRCREVRRLLERIDWPCDVLRDYSDINQGCDHRMTSGIDWAFTHVDEAILVEDDLVPDPTLFSWCAEMLDRYRGSDEVLCISGRNELGRWGDDCDDHHLIYRGSNFCCATWRRAWLRARAVPLPGPADAISRIVAEGRMDPWVARHFQWLRGLSSRGFEHGWDTQWELRRALLGGLSAVPPVNLVAHAGFDDEASHACNVHSLRSLQPVGRAPRPNGRIKTAPDHLLDRWSLFISLLDTCRAPRMLRRLARSPLLGTDPDVQYHLGPFIAASDSRGALRLLRDLGAHSARLDSFIEAFEETGFAAAEKGA